MSADPRYLKNIGRWAPRVRISSVLLHEWVFTALLILTSLRAIAKGMTLSTMAFLFLAFMAGICIFLNLLYSSNSLNPSRHYRFFAVTLGIYSSLGIGIHAIYSEQLISTALDWDQRLEQFDILVFGEPLFRLTSSQIQAWPPYVARVSYDFLSFAYLLLLPIEAAALRILSKDVSLLRRFSVGLFTLSGLGFFIYTIVPAMGPSATIGEPPLGILPTSEIPSIMNFQYTLTRHFSIGYDVFPSLHVAVPFYVLAFAVRYSTFKIHSLAVLALPVLILSISAVSLGYHYLADTLAGAILGGVGILAIAVQSYLDSSVRGTYDCC